MKQIKDLLINRSSTIFLRVAIVILGAAVTVFAGLILSAIYRGWDSEMSHIQYAKYPLLTVLSASLLTFYAVLYQALRVLAYIDKNKTFSKVMVRTLNTIKRYAFTMSIFHVLALPFVYAVAQQDDAPGLVVIGMLFAIAPFAISVFAALMRRLLQSAIDIKSENDLTV